MVLPSIIALNGQLAGRTFLQRTQAMSLQNARNLPARSYARRASVDEQMWLNNLEENRFLAETPHLSVRERSLLPPRKTTSWAKSNPQYDGEIFSLYSSFRDGDSFRFAASTPTENDAGRTM